MWVIIHHSFYFVFVKRFFFDDIKVAKVKFLDTLGENRSDARWAAKSPDILTDYNLTLSYISADKLTKLNNENDMFPFFLF